MKRWLATITIIILIIGGVVWEQIYVKKTFDELEGQLDTLLTSVNACPDNAIDTPENIAQVTALAKNWRQRERNLCFLVKHTETFQISDTILYAQNFIEFGNKEEAMLALNKLAYLFSVHHYNLGTSLESII